MFFENKTNLEILEDFLQKTVINQEQGDSQSSRLSLSRDIIQSIYRSPAEWDESCPFNIKDIGKSYISWIINIDISNPTHIDSLYSMSYRFLCEFEFFTDTAHTLNRNLREIKSLIESDIDSMSDSAKSEIIYASYIMPANIVKDFINDSNIGVFKGFEQKKIEAEKLKEEWDKEIASKEATAKELKDKLEEYKIGFNFVGLYQGFSNLADKKVKERCWNFWALIGMGILVLIPLIFEIILIGMHSTKDKPVYINELITLVPFVSIELILIYFFRIILLNHRSIKAQIMQIELRQTLCQFIQSYASYASEMKKQDASALEKFESLIFSGVLSDPESLPSTFDGMEQFGNLINKLKK